MRPYGSGCTHEHACIRCNFLHVHPDAAGRLERIEQDLQQRLEEASTQHWLADVEQLRLTLRRLQDKKNTLRAGEAQSSGPPGFAVHQPLDVPAVEGVPVTHSPNSIYNCGDL